MDKGSPLCRAGTFELRFLGVAAGVASPVCDLSEGLTAGLVSRAGLQSRPRVSCRACRLPVGQVFEQGAEDDVRQLPLPVAQGFEGALAGGALPNVSPRGSFYPRGRPPTHREGVPFRSRRARSWGRLGKDGSQMLWRRRAGHLRCDSGAGRRPDDPIGLGQIHAGIEKGRR